MFTVNVGLISFLLLEYETLEGGPHTDQAKTRTTCVCFPRLREQIKQITTNFVAQNNTGILPDALAGQEWAVGPTGVT